MALKSYRLPTIHSKHHFLEVRDNGRSEKLGPSYPVAISIQNGEETRGCQSLSRAETWQLVQHLVDLLIAQGEFSEEEPVEWR